MGDNIAVSHEFVSLKWLRISEDKYQWSLKTLEKWKTNLPEGCDGGLPPEYSAQTWVEMHEMQDQEDQVEVMAARIGNIGIVGLPGEVFCEFGIEIKKKCPAKHTIVIELANDAIGSLPTPETFEQGGYEITPGATRYEANAGEKLSASAINQLKNFLNS